ncbi:hypothetical protein HanRHA438_Chr17g0831791 [Helianthus annuus]|nr:hypothetical protein HanRHA438_Chr17g0831791 [Helianthus annuus]
MKVVAGNMRKRFLHVPKPRPLLHHVSTTCPTCRGRFPAVPVLFPSPSSPRDGRRHLIGVSVLPSLS